MKRSRTYLPATTHALQALGAQIAAGRREMGWSAAELAGRLGVTAPLVTRIEKGAPGTAVGTVLEAAILCGVPLFGADPDDLDDVAERTRDRLALLPQRVRSHRIEIDNDF
ncbi:Helix-turn-helix domain-containing protein [Sanguibacter gelidistatuariae]|uniref:Helix-turn-helix domain-containing protein n=1 Tax=Sanguibacter gelidistatuariae TaxID=1814289 RepID=A0A1G6JQ29_9MICO|nr:helix-turn-helix domain-containing protein [Sanguibacter gelidistatuariae]SDC20778.1 Helix-turn-helix domain-containing protein [Sanguibacter gelidistatuariae]